MRRTVDRREFVKTIGAAGALGAIAPAPGGAVAAQGAQAAGGAAEFQRPANLRKGAQLDSRFPVSFATPVTEGFRLVAEYFTALASGISTRWLAPFISPSRSTRTSSRSSSQARPIWRRTLHHP